MSKLSGKKGTLQFVKKGTSTGKVKAKGTLTFKKKPTPKFNRKRMA